MYFVLQFQNSVVVCCLIVLLELLRKEILIGFVVLFEDATLHVVKFEVHIGLLGLGVEDVVCSSEDEVGRDESASALVNIMFALQSEGECSDVFVNGLVHFPLRNLEESIVKTGFFELFIVIFVHPLNIYVYIKTCERSAP